MSSNVSERQAHEVAEAARESEWKLPSFGRELFLGNFRLDLIHPQPRLDPEAIERGERFLARLREFLEADVDPLEIEREAKIPETVIDGLKRLGALGTRSSASVPSAGPRPRSWPSCSARTPSGASKRCSERSGTTTTTPTGPRRRACWTGATGGSRKGSPTPRARAR